MFVPRAECFCLVKEKKPVERKPQVKRARSASPSSPSAVEEPQTTSKQRSSKRRRVGQLESDEDISFKGNLTKMGCYC